MTEIRRCAVIGAGVIGGGWAARFILNGLDVAVFDPLPDAERRTRAMLTNAARAFAKLTLAPLPQPGGLRFVDTVAEAVSEADFVQESAPEREDLKCALMAEIDTDAPRGRPRVLLDLRTASESPAIRHASSRPLPGRPPL